MHQGSVLSFISFLLYISDVFDEIDKFGLVGHAFADDIQRIVSSSPEFIHCAINRFVVCLSEIDAWMSSNRLKLN